MAINLQFIANLNNAQILQALKQINVTINNTTNIANNNFNNVGRAAGASGAQIGAMAGVVGAVTTAFIQLGQQAIGALVGIAEQGVQTAIEMDTLKARLGGIFDGSQEAADEAFGFIQEKSKELGINLSELAGAFLPKTESLEQFERVAKIATALARSDPEQGAIGARIALIEALSGTFTSLQRRFEIPKEDINNIKAAFDTGGMEGFLEELEKTLAASGKSFDDLANTAQTSFNKLAITGEQLGGRIGVPIVASLEEAANKLLEFIDANEDDLIVFADTIGRAIADVIDFIASVDLSQLDTEGLIEFADYIFRVVNAVQLAVGQFTGFVGAVYQVTDAISPLGEILDYFAYILSNIDDALITASQVLAIAKAGYIGLYEGIQPVVEILEKLYEAAALAAGGDLVGAQAALSEASQLTTQDLFDEVAAREAAQASVLESAQAIEDYHSSVEENTDSQRALREELEATANAGTDAADAILAAGAAERQAAEDAEALEAAQKKVNEALAEAKKDFDRKLEDIDIAAERRRLEIAIEFAQKREDAARDNLRKIADLRERNADDIADAEQDLERKESDIARKFADERIDLEREQRQKRVDIETQFREKLQEIQSQFLLDAEDAERNRDAISFLKALRNRDQQVSTAQTTRLKEIEETRLTGEQKLEELRIQQQRELEEARLANERKLEDLRTNLDRQIEEQNLAYERQLSDLATAETRKNEESARKREEDIEDAKRAYDRKLEDLQTSLAEELAIIAAGNAALEAEAARHAAAMDAAGESNRSSGSRNAPSSDDPPSSRPGQQNRQRQQGPTSRQGQQNQGRQRQGQARRGFASGGSMTVPGGYPNDSYTIGLSSGEKVDVTPEGKPARPASIGPAIRGFQSSSAGLLAGTEGVSAMGIAPPVVLPTTAPQTTVSNVDNSQTQQINLPLATPGQLLDPVMIAALRNVVRSELGKVL